MNVLLVVTRRPLPVCLIRMRESCPPLGALSGSNESASLQVLVALHAPAILHLCIFASNHNCNLIDVKTTWREVEAVQSWPPHVTPHLAAVIPIDRPSTSHVDFDTELHDPQFRYHQTTRLYMLTTPARPGCIFKRASNTRYPHPAGPISNRFTANARCDSEHASTRHMSTQL